MLNLNTKPSYDKLNELYEIALNNNRLLVEKHKKEIAGNVARNRALENEIKKAKYVEPPKNVVNNEHMPLLFWFLMCIFIGTILGTILGIIFK